MNLHGIVSSAIGTVNPQVLITVRVSTGSEINDDGDRIPTYASAVQVLAQVQALESNDLSQADDLSIQGIRRKVYLNGEVNGLVRPMNKGGDLITLPDGSVWLVKMVLEHWPDWTCCAIVLQNGA